MLYTYFEELRSSPRESQQPGGDSPRTADRSRARWFLLGLRHLFEDDIAEAQLVHVGHLDAAQREVDGPLLLVSVSRDCDNRSRRGRGPSPAGSPTNSRRISRIRCST
jgi:hypothetical protein